jgi:glucose-1-phosphate thymidylyltransferase
MDMVEINPDRSVRKIRIKPADTNLEFTWIIAVWTPNFTRFMHEYVLNEKIRIKQNVPSIEPKELFLGDVIQAAIQDDLNVSSVTFTTGRCLDIGSSEDLVKAIQIKTLNLNSPFRLEEIGVQG